jgi:XRE family transcriptional regulator, aerobic/anaerobic benzoate catabolism transcriptional regulator
MGHWLQDQLYLAGRSKPRGANQSMDDTMGTPRQRRSSALETAPTTEDDSKFVAEIGERVRTTRAKRGMTRKMLAHDSQISERYLAQIESGRGNPTVLVLKAIAKAFHQDVEQLLPERQPTDPALQEALQILGHLPAAQLPAALEYMKSVTARAADRAQRIALVGLRGAGKSTLGLRLADALGLPFIELNRLVEQSYGASVSLLIEMSGQATFREYERKCLESVIGEQRQAVIATAGGIVAERETYDRLLATCHVIWIEASPEDHMSRVMAQGDFRPMAQEREAMSGLRAILEARNQDYARAEARLNTSGQTIADSLRELVGIARGLLSK